MPDKSYRDRLAFLDNTIEGAPIPWPPVGDVDDYTMDIVDQVADRTMTLGYKLVTLIDSVRYLAENRIPGDIVECGVWRGGSMMAAARALLEAGDDDRTLWLYDTFSGMTQPGGVDVRVADGVSAASVLSTAAQDSHFWATATREDVEAGLRTVGYPADRVRYVQGDVMQTLPGTLPNAIALLRLDTDWYESTRHELIHLYPLLSRGGVLIIDDYGCWRGARRASDEYLAKLTPRPLLIRIGDGRVAVKPA